MNFLTSKLPRTEQEQSSDSAETATDSSELLQKEMEAKFASQLKDVCKIILLFFFFALVKYLILFIFRLGVHFQILILVNIFINLKMHYLQVLLKVYLKMKMQIL